MPLLKIETRPKASADDEPDGPQAAETQAAPNTISNSTAREKAKSSAPMSSARRARMAREAGEAKPTTGGAMKAIAGGAFVGLIIVAGVGAYLFGRQSMASNGAGSAVPSSGPSASGGAGAIAAGGPATPVPPLNADYDRSAIIATIGSEPYRMSDLESAVRVSHALASLAGEQLTPYNSPGMRDFQIQMLKRQIDIVLMKQAVLRENIAVPGGDISAQIDSYLQRIGSSRQKLNEAMAANGVTEAEVKKWFEDSRTSSTYVVEKLLKGKDLTQREAVTKAWLDAEWKARESDILINFYEPSPSLAAGTPPATSSSNSAP